MPSVQLPQAKGEVMIRLMILACAMASAASAAPSEATLTTWLDETARLESSNRDWAIGDKGASRGAYQIQKATWKAYSKVPWRTGAHDPVESKAGGDVRECQVVVQTWKFSNPKALTT